MKSRPQSSILLGCLGAGFLLGILIPPPLNAAEPPDSAAVITKLGDRGLAGRSAPVHLLSLFDQEGAKILSTDDFPLPFSMEQTCNPCHDYERISGGWHFNAGSKEIDPGRPGQPWIYVDTTLGIQLPLSYRNWPGIMHPEELGISRWDFLEKFGGLMPGGWGADWQAAQPVYRPEWFTAGEPEVNCLACHNRSLKQDRAEYHRQMELGNYAWAATAAAGLADVSGSTHNLPPLYDPFLPRPLDEEDQNSPRVRYGPGLFTAKDKVWLDLTRRISDERCYACHSSLYAHEDPLAFDPLPADVHITAGMACVDCHNNNLDHQITRGYEGAKDEESWASCRGCHLGQSQADSPAGRFGAPEPAHAGLPASHLVNLSCTTCHSGPWPQHDQHLVKTSQSHALGTHAVDPAPSALPAIAGPVYLPGADGKLAPQLALWPAYWGLMDEQTIQPLHLEQVRKLRAVAALNDSTLEQGRWPRDSNDVALALAGLDSLFPGEGPPVYVSAGLVAMLQPDGQLISVLNSAGDPYTWPIAHAVRPARQALGAGGCRDCHAGSAAFFYGNIGAATLGYPAQGATLIMSEMMGVNVFYAHFLDGIILLRPAFKFVLILGTILISAIVLLISFKLLSKLLNSLAPKRWEP
ncbi:MAG: hypothetical protein IID13_01305 [Candidatus Marinimicrobia bacterium]|nr:hypothetical protein [Candidatus Neomarinimicrobiota bacterium]